MWPRTAQQCTIVGLLSSEAAIVPGLDGRRERDRKSHVQKAKDLFDQANQQLLAAGVSSANHRRLFGRLRGNELETSRREEAWDVETCRQQIAQLPREGFMPKYPIAKPLEAWCHPRLPEAALAFRRTATSPLTIPNTSTRSISQLGCTEIKTGLRGFR